MSKIKTFEIFTENYSKIIQANNIKRALFIFSQKTKEPAENVIAVIDVEKERNF